VKDSLLGKVLSQPPTPRKDFIFIYLQTINANGEHDEENIAGQ
jgi:hypothetical protein